MEARQRPAGRESPRRTIPPCPASTRTLALALSTSPEGRAKWRPGGGQLGREEEVRRGGGESPQCTQRPDRSAYGLPANILTNPSQIPNPYFTRPKTPEKIGQYVAGNYRGTTALIFSTLSHWKNAPKQGSSRG